MSYDLINGILLKQEQKVTQNLILQVNILQMNMLELKQYLNNLCLENPVMDIDFDDLQREEQERLKKLERFFEIDEENRIYYKNDIEEREAFDIERNAQEGRETVNDYLKQQIHEASFSKTEAEICSYIADNLDDNGFFTDSAELVSRALCVDEKAIEICLEKMKCMDPPGICASSLSECLKIQLLRNSYKNDDIEVIIVTKYLTDLAKNRIPHIAKTLGIKQDRVKKASDIIKSLNPIPSRGFSNNKAVNYINPDIIILRQNGYFKTEINEYTYPHIRLSPEYMKMLRSKDCDADVKHYLSEKVKQIEYIQSFIEKRNSTLSRLSEYIVNKQEKFFIYGKGYLNPLRMKDAADALDLCGSTISRAVRGKYLYCGQGVFSLDFFFCKGVSVDSDEGVIARDNILIVLGDIIEREDKANPLSDNAICESLKTRGISISRRTVAKYRMMLDIPGALKRKKFAD